MKYESKIIETAIAELVEMTDAESKPDAIDSTPDAINMPGQTHGTDEKAQEPNESSPSLGAPTAETSSSNCPKPFSYRDLKKIAREILLFTAINFNTLFKEQGVKDYPKIAEVKFVEFSFGSQALMGMFRTTFADKEKYPEPGIVFAKWNGNKVEVF